MPLVCIRFQGWPSADIGQMHLGACCGKPTISEDVMIRAVPRREDTQDAANLTTKQKVIGVCLLLFYLAMIGVTIATSKFNIANPSTLTIPQNVN